MSRWEKRRRSGMIALVRPAVSRWQLYRWYAPLGSREAPLGLLYLASHLERHGFRVSLLDGEQIGNREILKRIRTARPDMIGITSSTFSFKESQSLVRAIRRQLPDALIVMGGPHASALPSDTLNRIEELDGCVVGEGEESLLEIASGAKPECVPGLVWRDGGNLIQINVVRDCTSNLDQYRLNWNLLENFPTWYQPGLQDRGRGMAISLMASRGCSYNCTFCAGPALHGKQHRAHSPQIMVEMMTSLEAEYGIKNFYFHDDNFTQDQDWVIDFCERLAQTKRDIQWSCASRVETLSKQVLAKMRRAGCYQIGIGVESGSDRILKWLNKGVSFDRMKECIENVLIAGIGTKLYLIIGTPIETIADLGITFMRVMRLKPSHIQVIYFTPLPGSHDGQRIQLPEHTWSKMNLLNPVAVPLLRGFLLRIVEFGFYASFYICKLLRRSASTTAAETAKEQAR